MTETDNKILKWMDRLLWIFGPIWIIGVIIQCVKSIMNSPLF